MFRYQDQVTLTVASGSGGSGTASFFRTKKNPRGGPDGGDGGDGGDVLFSSSHQFNDLYHFQKKRIFQAERGKSGNNQLKTGARGQDLEIYFPLGTVVKNEKKEIIKDFPIASSFLFLKGGKGGKGNAFFKTSLNQAPKHFQKGMLGEKQKIILEFKPLAEVALVGKTNVGKSTFLNSVTRSSSLVASYPYTTLSPYLGQAEFFKKKYIIVDIPGLSKGASSHSSKGLSFLRSIQRSKILLHFIDISSETLLEDRMQMEEEFKIFDSIYKEDTFSSFKKKKRFLILSKCDEIKDEKKLKELKEIVALKTQLKVFSISCHTKTGLESLLKNIIIELEN